MKYCIYSVFDKELSVYDNTYCFQNDVYCRRYFEGICQKNQDLQKRASIFSIHKIGEFDSEKGELKPIVPQVVFEMSVLTEFIEEGLKLR